MMAVSRRLRFEILRRDSHTCRYCGESAPTVKLTVDHVIAVTLGGSDDPSNLVTACQPCNAGKSSVPVDASTVRQVTADAFRLAGAIQVVMDQRRSDLENLCHKAVLWEEYWDLQGWDAKGQWDPVPLDVTAQSSVIRFLKLGYSIEQLYRFVDAAMESSAARENKFRYFCGCVWTDYAAVQAKSLEVVKGCHV